MAFVEWLKYIGIRYFNHSPNEGRRTAREGDKLKKMGMSRGFPDIEIPYPRHQKHGLYIEFKSKTGKLTPSQKDWLEHLNSNGYVAVVCRSFDEARKVTTEYLKK